jgi:putative methyltransferase (TIGR04325 family)
MKATPMNGTDTLQRVANRIRRWPGVYQLRRRAYDRDFCSLTQAHMFRGIFDSFEAAAASAPRNRPTSYDNPRSASMYLNQLEVQPKDYPAAFWLLQSLGGGLRRVVDLGGSVGIKYFAFRRLLLERAPDLDWQVIDMPAVVERGRQFAVEQGAGPALGFSSELHEAQNADILFASGSLQYLPQTMAALMSGWPRLPRRFIVNSLPLHPNRSYFTLNSIGTAYCPYRVQSEPEFLTAMGGAGYRVLDRWTDPNKVLRLPFEQGHDLDHYSGFCFELDSTM